MAKYGIKEYIVTRVNDVSFNKSKPIKPLVLESTINKNQIKGGKGENKYGKNHHWQTN
jgi:hypothetical protein